MAHPMRGKVLLITGGTGSFGRTVLGSVLGKGLKEIRIFSRDEKKQEQMRIEISDPRVKFFIGDVRSRDSVDEAMSGVDYVFHAAALKQVPSCEFYPDGGGAHQRSRQPTTSSSAAIANRRSSVIVPLAPTRRSIRSTPWACPRR